MLVAPAVFANYIYLGCEITGGGAVFYSSAYCCCLCWGMANRLPWGAFRWCSALMFVVFEINEDTLTFLRELNMPIGVISPGSGTGLVATLLALIDESILGSVGSFAEIVFEQV